MGKEALPAPTEATISFTELNVTCPRVNHPKASHYAAIVRNTKGRFDQIFRRKNPETPVGPEVVRPQVSEGDKVSFDLIELFWRDPRLIKIGHYSLNVLAQNGEPHTRSNPPLRIEFKITKQDVEDVRIALEKRRSQKEMESTLQTNSQSNTETKQEETSEMSKKVSAEKATLQVILIAGTQYAVGGAKPGSQVAARVNDGEDIILGPQAFTANDKGELILEISKLSLTGKAITAGKKTGHVWSTNGKDGPSTSFDVEITEELATQLSTKPEDRKVTPAVVVSATPPNEEVKVVTEEVTPASETSEPLSPEITPPGSHKDEEMQNLGDAMDEAISSAPATEDISVSDLRINGETYSFNAPTPIDGVEIGVSDDTGEAVYEYRTSRIHDDVRSTEWKLGFNRWNKERRLKPNETLHLEVTAMVGDERGKTASVPFSFGQSWINRIYGPQQVPSPKRSPASAPQSAQAQTHTQAEEPMKDNQDQMDEALLMLSKLPTVKQAAELIAAGVTKVTDSVNTVNTGVSNVHADVREVKASVEDIRTNVKGAGQAVQNGFEEVKNAVRQGFDRMSKSPLGGSGNQPPVTVETTEKSWWRKNGGLGLIILAFLAFAMVVAFMVYKTPSTAAPSQVYAPVPVITPPTPAVTPPAKATPTSTNISFVQLTSVKDLGWKWKEEPSATSPAAAQGQLVEDVTEEVIEEYEEVTYMDEPAYHVGSIYPTRRNMVCWDRQPLIGLHMEFGRGHGGHRNSRFLPRNTGGYSREGWGRNHTWLNNVQEVKVYDQYGNSRNVRAPRNNRNRSGGRGGY